jgi:hypothetical protein
MTITLWVSLLLFSATNALSTNFLNSPIICISDPPLQLVAGSTHVSAVYDTRPNRCNPQFTIAETFVVTKILLAKTAEQSYGSQTWLSRQLHLISIQK